MRAPPVNSVEGAYWYLIGTIVLLALFGLLYLAGMWVGFLPDFASLPSPAP